MDTVYELDQLPQYLQDLFSNANQTIAVLELLDIKRLASAPDQYRHLLLRRHALTEKISECGLCPIWIYQRAQLYEVLGYADLAAADAFVVYILCESVRSDEWITDLQPVTLSGQPWQSDGDEYGNLVMLCVSLVVLCTALVRLGATKDAKEKFEELVARNAELNSLSGSDEELQLSARKYLRYDTKLFQIWTSTDTTWEAMNAADQKFGWSRREIYPWNNYEPDRNAPESLSEINLVLSQIAPDLEARVTVLPALNEDGSPSDGTWHQLGLFATKDLASGTEILREKSLLTAIRPLDDALCDACGADLESIPRDSMRQCPGEDCDTTFCSGDCATRAASEYHKPNLPDREHDNDNDDDEENDNDEDYPPRHAPFCGNTALHEIGRTSSTTTPEQDLYFLLLTRSIQLSTTQALHPLTLPTTKFLWGDFNSGPNPTSPSETITNPKNTLPWSLHHNLSLPLQYFETVMHSDARLRPYSKTWLRDWDWWIQSTLVAKFRGVANAQQSTFDGKAEIAAVHPMWCLANHSCSPNVGWTPVGERVFTVRAEDGESMVGLNSGDEIWSHYTDVRSPVGQRRERLMEVLGGVCTCPRCVREAAGGEKDS